jgi:hypothetical protein
MWLASAILGPAVLLAPMGASAQVTTRIEPFLGGGSDCTPVFGDPFENCAIPNPDPNQDPLSAVMARYDAITDPETGGIVFNGELNTAAFPSLDGSEFLLVALSDNGGIGSFEYTQGQDDPELRYWVANFAGGFLLYYYLADASDTREDAIAASQGAWVTAAPPGEGPLRLTQITFYDTAAGGGTIPEPGALSLFGLALAGIALVNRRRVRAQAA